MIRKASILGISLLLAGAAIASAQEKKPLSPAGTAATMVGGAFTTDAGPSSQDGPSPSGSAGVTVTASVSPRPKLALVK